MDEKCGIGNSTNKSARKYDSKTNPSRSIKLIVVKDQLWELYIIIRENMNLSELKEDCYVAAQGVLNIRSEYKSCTRQTLTLLLSQLQTQIKKLIMINMDLKAKLIDLIRPLSLKMCNLKSIDLGSNCIESAGMARLFSHQWPILKQIHLGENQLGNEGLKPVLINCPKLEKMNLDSNHITHMGLKYMISNSINLTNLQHLVLSNNKICLKGAEYLGKANLKLVSLVLTKTFLTNQSISKLVKADWPLFQQLSIDENDIAPSCLGYIQLSNWKLQELTTSFNCRLSISYFSAVVRAASRETVLKIQVNMRCQKYRQELMNSNVKVVVD